MGSALLTQLNVVIREHVKNHLRIINTYGACARGGGRRPGFEARLRPKNLQLHVSKQGMPTMSNCSTDKAKSV